MLRGPDWISTLIYGITVCPAGAKTDSPHQAFDSTEPCRLESLQSSAARHLIERTSAIVPTAALFTNAAPLFNPDCRNWVAVPFKMIRDQRPHLMLSAMTIVELATLREMRRPGREVQGLAPGGRARLREKLLMAWDQRFFDPIIVPKGKPLVTLRDAGNYVASLPEHEQRLPHWQTATELLLMVGSRGGDPMMVRIAMMQALNHGKPNPATTPRRKRAKAYRIVR
jgi:hypothetical protein